MISSFGNPFGRICLACAQDLDIQALGIERVEVKRLRRIQKHLLKKDRRVTMASF